RIGATLGNGSTEEITALGDFFLALGTAYQAIDDVINVAGLHNNTKERGEDLRTGRITLPVVHFLRAAARDSTCRIPGGDHRCSHAWQIARFACRQRRPRSVPDPGETGGAIRTEGAGAHLPACRFATARRIRHAGDRGLLLTPTLPRHTPRVSTPPQAPADHRCRCDGPRRI